MRRTLIAVMLACGSIGAAPARAEVNVGIGINLPGVSIGINMPSYPQFARVPEYPVYYAPGVNANYFFYDGLYWVYQGDRWYESTWYNGPWAVVEPDYVPVYLLRVPVRYYRAPPAYFHAWSRDAAPRWDEHWGREWERDHRDWNRRDGRAAPAPAPLPTYQRQYTGRSYPAPEQQRQIETRNYHFEPRDPVARQRFEQPVERAQRPIPTSHRSAAPEVREPQRAETPAAPQRPAPMARAPEATARPADSGAPSRGSRPPTPAAAPAATPAAPQPIDHGQGRGEPRQQGDAHGQGQDHGQGQGQGHGKDRPGKGNEHGQGNGQDKKD